MIGRWVRVLCIAALAAATAAARSYIVRLRDHADSQQVAVLANLVSHRDRDGRLSRHRGAVREAFTHRLFKGFVATDVSPAMHEELLNHPMVDRIYPDLPRQAAAPTLPWGLDRLDQQSLPLDGAYRPQLQGEKVNVFVLDSGIDTTHEEFRSTGRVVKNIYDHYIKSKLNPDSNNDAYGHGTHVAGIVGGRNVGVAPKTNVYGVKILDDKGAGTDSTVLAGLLHVADWVEAERERTGQAVPAVVCMSLGGSCLFPGCENEIMIDIMGNFTARGIHMVAAAGNNNCESCNAAPAASTSVLTVGATTSSDAFGSYSNKGQCVDIMAPGSQISSACSSKRCGGTNKYQYKTGTSMAAPHVTGVVAHILTAHPSATSDEVRQTMLCTASRGKVQGLPADTRNLLAQVLVAGQDVSTLNWSCDRGAGCAQACSGRGDCLSGKCICDPGFYGSSCESTNPAADCAMDQVGSVNLDLISFKAKGWPSLSYVLSAADGRAVKSGTLPCGASARETLCLAPGCYTLETKGRVATDVSSYAWSVCGASGNIPSTLDFCVDETGSCQVSYSECSHAPLELQLRDAFGDGWAGGALVARQEELGSIAFVGPVSPSPTYTRATLAWGKSETQRICLEDGIYSLAVGGGDFPEELSYSLCGVEGMLGNEIAVRVNGTHCTQALLHATFRYTIRTQGYDTSRSGSDEALLIAAAAEINRACDGCAFGLRMIDVLAAEGDQFDWALEIKVHLASKQVATRTSVHKLMAQTGQALVAPATNTRIQGALNAATGGDQSDSVIVTTAVSEDFEVQSQAGNPIAPTPGPGPTPSPAPTPGPAPSKRVTKVRAATGIWIAASIGSAMIVLGVVAALLVRTRSSHGHQRLQQDDQDRGHDDDMVEIELYDATAQEHGIGSELPGASWWRRWWATRSPQLAVQLGTPTAALAEDRTELLTQAHTAVAVTTVSESEL